MLLWFNLHIFSKLTTAANRPMHKTEITAVKTMGKNNSVTEQM